MVLPVSLVTLADGEILCLKLNTHFPIAQRRETAVMEVREFPDPQFSLNS